MAGRIYPVVSVLIPRQLSDRSVGFIMAQEAESGLWQLLGGGLDPADRGYLEAAKREVLEEGGFETLLTGFLGIYSFESLNRNRILCISFVGEEYNDVLAPRDPEISEARGMSLDEIKNLNERDKLRSGDANIASIEAYLRGELLSLNIFKYV